MSPEASAMPEKAPRLKVEVPLMAGKTPVMAFEAPLMPLQAVSDFLVADREGPGNNLEEYFFDEPFMIAEPKP